MTEIAHIISTIFLTIASFFGFHAHEDILGATSFPTSLDSFTNPTASDSLSGHASQHANANDAIEAIQVKVGIDGSAVNTTHDFKLSGVADGDYASSLAGTETLTNKTLTSPQINTGTFSTSTFTGSSTFSVGTGDFSLDLGSDATGDLYYRTSTGILARLGIGSNGLFLMASSTGLPEWTAQSPVTPTMEVTDNSTTTITLTENQTAKISVSASVDANCSGNCTLDLVMGSTTLDSRIYTDSATQDRPSILLFDADVYAATTSAILYVELQSQGYPTTALITPRWIIEKY